MSKILRCSDRMINFEELRKILLEENGCKRWIYDTKVKRLKQEWIRICERKKVYIGGYVHPYIYKCPEKIKPSYWRTNVIDECICCEYFVHWKQEDDYRQDNRNEIVFCSGKTKVKNVSDLENYLRNRTYR